VEGKNKNDTSKNRGDWNHFKIIQEIFEEQTWKVRYEGTTANSHIMHCACTSESSNVKVK
jgi:hypothetical protein